MSSKASHPNISVARDGHTSVVTLERPEKFNAITLSMWRALAEIVGQLGEDAETRSIVLTGAGANFSVGADISEFAVERSTEEKARAYERAVDACCDAIFSAPKPTFAAVRGFCLGGGCAVAMSCDFRIAEEASVFGIPAAKISIVYGVKATQKLLALVGLANAKRILFTGHRFPATEALAAGLVDEIVPDAMEAVLARAAAINANAPLSVAGAKTILNGLAFGLGALEAAAADAAIKRAAASEDFREGQRAFADRRAPAFTGR